LQTQNQNLEKQKTALDTQKSDLVDKQRNINILAKQKQTVLNQIASQKNQAKISLNLLYGEQNSVSSQIYDLRRSQGGYSGGGTGGYPWANASPNGVDPWGFYNRQCTSFAAWYWNNVEGKAWYNTRPGSGSAWNWPAMAGDQGYGVYSSPRVGDIVSWPAGGLLGSYGHVAIVTQVHGDGTFRVAQYNWSPLAYSEMEVSGSMASSGRFIR
jgi:surface antigen